LVVLIGIAIALAIEAGAQQVPTQRQARPDHRPAVWIDGSFQLGMAKDQVLSQLKTNYELTPVRTATPSDDWIILSRTKPADLIGELAFKNGRLVRVSRAWTTGREDGFEFARALYNLSKEFNDEGQGACLSATSSSSSPGGETRAISLSCKNKQIKIRLDEVVSGEAKGKFFILSEVLEEK
jgi:hypothetical protein